MREIKFRGKSGTQRRYGDLYHNERGELMIYEPKTSGQTLGGGAVDGWRIVVDPNTVGQYVGLKDSEGREIYEGDVVLVSEDGEESKHEVRYMDDQDYPAFDLIPASVRWAYESNGLSYCMVGYDANIEIRVIGNVHDNPELLERKP